MNDCIFIMGGCSLRDSHLVRLCARVAAISSPELVVIEPKKEVPERTLANVVASGALCAITNYRQDLPAEEPVRDWTEEILQGIADCVAELRHDVEQTLARHGGRRRQHVRTIFQPCWRSNRWKSLT